MVGPGHFRAGNFVFCAGTVGVECNGGEVAEFGAEEIGLSHFHVEACVVEVDILSQGTVDEVDEHRVGEHLLPFEVAEGRGVGGRFECFGILFGLRVVLRHLEFIVDVAGAERGDEHQSSGGDNYIFEFHTFTEMYCKRAGRNRRSEGGRRRGEIRSEVD